MHGSKFFPLVFVLARLLVNTNELALSGGFVREGLIVFLFVMALAKAEGVKVTKDDTTGSGWRSML